MAQTFEEWASTEVHSPDDKISNLDKLTAPYLLNKYKTWGEVYKAAGIKPPKEKTKAKAPDTVKDLNFKIKNLDLLISKNEDDLFRYEPGTADYKETAGAIKKFKEEIKGLKTRLSTAKKIETEKKETKTFQKESSDYEEAVADAREAVQIAKDTNGDVVAAEKELERITKNKPIAPVVGTENVGMAGQPSGYRNVGTQKVGTTPTPTTGTPPKGGTGGTGGTGGGKGTPPLTDTQQREEALNVAAGSDFALPETIFNNVPSLKAILDRYVREDWTPDKLRKAIRDDVWFRKNSAEIKARYVQLYNYRDLVATGQADGSTDYEKQISTLERQIADKARQMGSGIASDPAALRKAAENMYITNVGIDDAMTTDFIAAAIRPIGSMIAGQGTEGYSGQALANYQAIQSVARANGFKVSDIVPGGQTEQQVLQGIATGSIDPNRLAQDARKLAAQGQPQYVRDLLGQGYNLDQVYAPYRQTMANLLELNADQIDLNDATLRSAITDKGDMNIFDFKKQLKADNRWQYTENAKQEVSDAALKVLRDFGFQG
jgi:hypothetical protein